MGLGLMLTGTIGDRHDDPKSWLARLEAWLEENVGEPLEALRNGEDGAGHPTLFVTLHPCAEDVEIAVPGPGRVVVTAKSSTAGPGYHVFLCNLLRRLGDRFAITWDEPDEENSYDETGFFFHGDRTAVEAEFLSWLRGIARVVTEKLDEDYVEMMISMPIGHRYPHDGPLVTPLGPRDRAWLEAVAADPRLKIDLFPWWSEGVDAGFHLGRALCRIWKDVRWRKPLKEEEGALLMNVHLDLAKAYKLDPRLPFPWPEWHELIGHIKAYFGHLEHQGDDLEPLIARRAQAAPGSPRLGYRRRPVRVELTSGWSIEVPGEMAEEWDEHGTWSSWDGARTVWFSSYSFAKPDGTRPSAAEALEGLTLPEGERFQHESERVIGVASIVSYEEDGKTLWQLAGRSAVEGGLGVCSIYFPDESDRDWAVSVWKSLDHA